MQKHTGQCIKKGGRNRTHTKRATCDKNDERGSCKKPLTDNWSKPWAGNWNGEVANTFKFADDCKPTVLKGRALKAPGGCKLKLEVIDWKACSVWHQCKRDWDDSSIYADLCVRQVGSAKGGSTKSSIRTWAENYRCGAWQLKLWVSISDIADRISAALSMAAQLRCECGQTCRGQGRPKKSKKKD